MIEQLNVYVPDQIAPIDPKVIEAVSGRQEQLLQKLRQVLLNAGVIQLPNGSLEPTSFIFGDSSRIQAFSSFENTVFITVTEDAKNDNPYTRMYTDKPNFNIIFLIVRIGAEKPIFFTLNNLVKLAAYQKLCASAESYEFERFEFTNLPVEQVKLIFEQFLSSTPRPDLADSHYQTLTSPKTRIPGSGTVNKLY